MRILVDITHPAHVHFFRNAVNILRDRGHEVAITAREKDVTVELLKNYGFDFRTLSKTGRNNFELILEIFSRDTKLWNFCRKFRPDVLTAISGVFISHVGKIIGRPSVIWDDTEHQKLAHKITWPFATEIHSPDCYLKTPVKKQKLYTGFHELAYLHPKYFTADKDVVRSLGIDPAEKYCIIRFVSWGAHHDVGQHGFDKNRKVQFVEKIAKYARPYITSEAELPNELKKYQLNIPVHQIHHVMAFAKLCIGEGATMISESAVLGIPAVYINTLKLGYINMHEKYGLVKQTTDTDLALQYGLEFLTEPNATEKYQQIKQKLLTDKIDVTKYIVETVSNFAS